MRNFVLLVFALFLRIVLLYFLYFKIFEVVLFLKKIVIITTYFHTP